MQGIKKALKHCAIHASVAHQQNDGNKTWINCFKLSRQLCLF